MLRFKVFSIIRYVRNTKGGPFLILRFEVRPSIGYVRITEGAPFLILRFKVHQEHYFRTTDGSWWTIPNTAF